MSAASRSTSTSPFTSTVRETNSPQDHNEADKVIIQQNRFVFFIGNCFYPMKSLNELEVSRPGLIIY